GIIGVDAEGLCQPRAVRRLDRGKTKTMVDVAGRDEADPARAEDADAIVQNHVVIRPSVHRLSSVSSATSINTIAGPVLTSAPSGSIQRSGVRIAAPAM